MRKTKIIFITTGVQTGGAERQLALLAKGLKARDFDPVIISLTGSNTAGMLPDFAGLDVVELDCQPRLRNLLNLFRLYRIIKDIKADIIQGWMYGGNIFASIFGYKAGAKIYHAVRASDMDQKRYGSRIWMNAKLTPLIEEVIANSYAGADFHVAKGFNAENMKVISNGIDTELFNQDDKRGKLMRERLGIKPDEVSFLYAARMDPMKAHDTVLSVARLCPEIRFILAGAETEDLDVPDNVIALGIRHDMPALYNATDWCLSLSNYGEGFPNVIAEAMACGTPVCANDVGDSKLIIENNEHLIIENQPEKIAKQIKILAKRRISKSAQKDLVECIKRQFSIDIMLDNYQTLYSKHKKQSNS